ncbi:ABC transporter ATP-binding protein [Chitinimonas arctica]|uniref:ABC transporter ATP-binding protein n=1 Tax=Chitinimonas arctica TaxID=2594795 RepID=UPI0027E4CF32|nr:nitrate/sulfonate/bicarbonate ABC transporter ATP-binding protein [Chitinimonas arctica]
MHNDLPTPSRHILVARDLCRGFDRERDERLVLDGVDLALCEGEIVGLLGRSGSGKSTLLRMLAGLIPPTSGYLEYRGSPVNGPAEGVAMVFQTFALFPWLTVLDNVEAGLEALGVPPKARRERALAAIDLIGLDGFESAFPRELSGGMRQRVGFARALVVNPTLLLIDEPFSALDVLTAETLRTDLLELWTERQLPIKSMLIVTHNIEEAVFMCDRILLLSSNPGRVVAEFKVPFKHRRDRLDPAFRQLVDDIYARMTARPVNGTAHKSGLDIGSPLERVSTNLMAGLIETVAADPYGGRADLPEIAGTMHLEVDDLFPVAEMLGHLGFAELREGDIVLTEAGMLFHEYGMQARKALFAAHLLKQVGLASYICTTLAERKGQRAPRARFEQKLEDFLSDELAGQALEAVIEWGRYAGRCFRMTITPGCSAWRMSLPQSEAAASSAYSCHLAHTGTVLL